MFVGDCVGVNLAAICSLQSSCSHLAVRCLVGISEKENRNKPKIPQALELAFVRGRKFDKAYLRVWSAYRTCSVLDAVGETLPTRKR